MRIATMVGAALLTAGTVVVAAPAEAQYGGGYRNGFSGYHDRGQYRPAYRGHGWRYRQSYRHRHRHGYDRRWGGYRHGGYRYGYR